MIGQAATETITLSSTGTSAVTISSLGVTGSQFSVSGITTPLALSAGQSATLTLSFNPLAGSGYTGALKISSNSSSGNLTVNLSGSGVPVPSSLFCSLSSMSGAGSDSCTVTLNGTAPYGGSVVRLMSNKTAVTVPSAVTVPYNATTATFNATVAAVTKAETATLSAIVGVSQSFALLLNPSASTATLSALSCSSSAISSPGPDACTVGLTAAAPSGGLTISLASNNASVIVPSSVTVPSGATCAAFNAAVGIFSSTQTATLSASAGGTVESFPIKLNAGTSTLSVSSTSVSFGNVQLGQTSTSTVTLSSTGPGAVTISSLSMAGSQFAASGITTPLTLSSGQTATVTISFAPNSGAGFTGALTIASNSSTGNLVVNMSGSGVPVPRSLSCNSASMSGAGTDSCTVTLNGAAPSGGSVVKLQSSNASVTVPATVTVPYNQTSASFSATVAAVTNTQTATISAMIGASQSFALTLNPGAGTPTLAVSSTTVSFGNVNVGKSGTQVLTLSSTGTGPVTISSLSVAGSLFAASGIATPLTLNPGQTATLTVSMTPIGGSTFTGVLTIVSNSMAGNLIVNMSGNGIPVPASLSCSSASMATAGTDTCTVSLNGAAPWGGFLVSLVSNNSAVVVPSSVTVAYNTTSATFSATVAAVSSAQTVTLSAGATSGTTSFALQLNATAPGSMSVSTSSISFGSVAIADPVTQSLTVTASGGPVTINSVGTTGSGFAVVAMGLPMTLAAGQSATVNVEFAPTVAGAATGMLTIAGACSGSGKATVNLSGTGMSYSVNLNWDAPASSSDPVAGYNIYRALNGSSSFQQLNSSTNTSTSFTDWTVQTGENYQYYVVSVDSQGEMSVPSNTATVAIP
jgi:hypothetical protein